MNASKHPEVQFFGRRSLISRLVDVPSWFIGMIADRLPTSPELLSVLDKLAAWFGSRNVDVVVQEIDVNGVRAIWVCAPEVTSPRQTILHVHGGGFVFGTPEMYRGAAALLSAATNSRVLLFDYRHPPQATVDDMAADCLAVYRWLVRRKSPARLLVTGDSAGGNLAFGMLAAARDSGLPMPAGLVAISAWLDPDYRHFRGPKDSLWPTRFAENAAELCRDGRDLSKLVRPLELDHHGFPPVLMQAGSTEPLANSNRTMASQLARAGVPATLQLWRNQIHVFQLVLGNLPESRAALAEINAFVDSVCGSGSKRRLGVV